MQELAEELTKTEEKLLDIMEEAGFTEEEMEIHLATYYELGVTEEVYQKLLVGQIPCSKAHFRKVGAEVVTPILKELKAEGKP